MAATAYTDAQSQNNIDRNVRQYSDLDLFFSKKISDNDISKIQMFRQLNGLSEILCY